MLPKSLDQADAPTPQAGGVEAQSPGDPRGRTVLLAHYCLPNNTNASLWRVLRLPLLGILLLDPKQLTAMCLCA